MLRIVGVSIVATALGGCAALDTLHSEVSTYGPWPADRKPSTFVFERLPSQQAHPGREVTIETAARGALEAAGFRAVADPNDAQYLMQIGARVTSNDPWIYNDPLFLRAGFRRGYGYGHGGWRGPGWWGPGYGWGGPYDLQTFERQVVLLIRDRRSGQLLYEARADNAGPGPTIDYLMPAMFEAALNGFPSSGPNPREVATRISSP